MLARKQKCIENKEIRWEPHVRKGWQKDDAEGGGVGGEWRREKPRLTYINISFRELMKVLKWNEWRGCYPGGMIDRTLLVNWKENYIFMKYGDNLIIIPTSSSLLGHSHKIAGNGGGDRGKYVPLRLYG